MDLKRGIDQAVAAATEELKQAFQALQGSEGDCTGRHDLCELR